MDAEMVDVFAYYDWTDSFDLDEKAHEIFRRFHGKSVGSGCGMGERDIQYRVERTKAPLLIKQLKAAKFRAKQREIPSPSLRPIDDPTCPTERTDEHG